MVDFDMQFWFFKCVRATISYVKTQPRMLHGKFVQVAGRMVATIELRHAKQNTNKFIVIEVIC